MRSSVLLVSTLFLWALGCGGGSSAGNAGTGQTTPPSYVPVAGNWLFTSPQAIIGVFLTQTGGNLAGTGHINSNCFEQSQDIPFAGTVDADGTLVLNSTIGPDALPTAYTQIRGTVQNGVLTNPTVSVPCVQTSGGAGDVAGNLLPSVSGTWTATLGSNLQSIGLQVTLNLIQGTIPDQHGYLPITGTGTVSGSCLNGKTFSGTLVTDVPLINQSPSKNILSGPFLSIAFDDGQNDNLSISGFLSKDSNQFALDFGDLYTPDCRDEPLGTFIRKD